MSLALPILHRFRSVVIQRFVETEHHFPDVRKMVPRSPFLDQFAGVNKMVPAGRSERCAGINAEARDLEERIAENVAELLEA
jgi:hypothetical protein